MGVLGPLPTGCRPEQRECLHPEVLEADDGFTLSIHFHSELHTLCLVPVGKTVIPNDGL